MKCIIKKAKDYQKGFQAGLCFTGFEYGDIQWLGTDKQFYDKSK